MTGGLRPFLGWADELEEFRRAFEDVEATLKRRPTPEVERMLEELVLKAAPPPSHAFREVRELFESGVVHHPGSAAELFAEIADQGRESDQIHAMRLAVEGVVARYAAEHPGEIGG